MEVKPLRVVPSSDDTAGGGSGPQRKIDSDRKMEEGIEEKRGVVKEEGSSTKLGLGVGAYSASAINPVIPREKKPLFTEAQRRELQHQAFIFKHFAYNLPVPHHLVLPILKSVAATSQSGFGGICDQFPSFLGFSDQDFGYANMMDHEPHRCRRTDGKKWRCKEKVVPDQKYCERHIHRGRNRSRKPVEASEVNSSSLPKPLSKLHDKLISNTESANPDSNPLGIELIKTSIFTPSSHCNFETLATVRCKSSLGSRAGFSPVTMASPSSTLVTLAVPTATTISDTTSVASNNKSNLNFFRKDDYVNFFRKDVYAKSCVMHNNIGVRSSGIRSIINDSNISTGIGVSPRSVLQGDTVSASYHSLLINQNSTEPEPGRCRRTDGKKWRCRRAALSNQKYCATHMHRGAKKRLTDHEPLPSPAALPNIQKAYCAIPNTNLSMSIPASASFVEKSRGSSDSDTTISDTMNDYSYASFPEAASKLEPV